MKKGTSQPTAEESLQERTKQVRESEDAMRSIETRYRHLFENAVVGMFQTSPEGRFIEANPCLAMLLGFDSPQELKATFTDIGKQHYVNPKDRVLFKELLDREGSIRDFETQLFKKDGSVLWASLNARAVRDKDGSIQYYEGNLVDVTERKNTEEALRESEKRIRSIFRSAPVGIGLVVERVLKRVNRRLCEMTGFDEKELLDQNARILYPSDEEFEFVGREKYSLIARYGTGTVETRWRRRNGEIIDVLLSSTPLDLKDLTKGVTFTALDITNLKQAEKALRESEERYRTILESIAEGYYEVDLKGNLTFINDSVCELLGYSRDELLGMNYRDYTNADTAEEVFREFNQVYMTKKPARGFGWEVIRKDSTRGYVEASVSLMTDEGGNPTGFRGIVRDVSERKRAEDEQERLQAQLNQAQKLESVGRLAGGVAHDFNNMLGVILGRTELALSRLSPSDPLTADLTEVRKAAERSADLTRQLLAFARRQTISPRVLDLNETVEGMLKMLRRIIGDDIDLIWMPGKTLSPVKIDPSQLDQILVNLCVNARDAISDIGKIIIETGNAAFDEGYCTAHRGFAAGKYLFLSVTDNGCGMDKETLVNIFEPFFTTKEVGKGTGLGLATVYGAVKQNMGFINVFSEPGQGTKFSIYLPVHADKTSLVSEQAPTPAMVGGSETILLVEDNPAILEMTARMVERMGYTVLEAGTPGEAIRLAEKYSGRIHLLMTDVVMPEMNGRALAEKLLSFYPDIRRLFMSGYTADVIAQHGVLDEGVHFIQKPFSMRDLASKLREAMESGQASRSH